MRWKTTTTYKTCGATSTSTRPPSVPGTDAPSPVSTRSPCFLGVDPGTIRTGYGVLEESRGKLRLIAAGALAPPAQAPLAEKLAFLFEGLERLIATHTPSAIAVEGLFYAKNARSALVLGHARGVILLASARRAIPVFEYAPREVKKALVGNGSAEKEQE